MGDCRQTTGLWSSIPCIHMHSLSLSLLSLLSSQSPVSPLSLLSLLSASCLSSPLSLLSLLSSQSPVSPLLSSHSLCLSSPLISLCVSSSHISFCLSSRLSFCLSSRLSFLCPAHRAPLTSIKGTVRESAERLLILEPDRQSAYTPSYRAPEATC